MVVSPNTIDFLDACSTKYRSPFRLAIPLARSIPRSDKPACSKGSPLDDFYLHDRAYRDRNSVISAEFDRQDGFLPVFDNLRGESILFHPRHRLPPIFLPETPKLPLPLSSEYLSIWKNPGASLDRKHSNIGGAGLVEPPVQRLLFVLATIDPPGRRSLLGLDQGRNKLIPRRWPA
jgi:hypothetical protein